MSDKITAQIAFLNEADRLKEVLRATPIGSGARPENTGEHSWHVALFALVFADEAPAGVSVDRVIRMLLIHDLVEIDAGDTPIHGDIDEVAQAAAEHKAADRIFALLPAQQGVALRALWEEFEAAESPDAVFAKSIDRVQPVLQNLASGGGSWRDYNVTYDQLEARIGPKVRKGLPALWDHLTGPLSAWFAKHGPKSP